MGSYFVAKYRSHNAFTFSNSTRTEPTIRHAAQSIIFFIFCGFCCNLFEFLKTYCLEI